MSQTADSARAPGKSAKRAMATRAALLDVATDLFAEQGYGQTSIRDIARKASVTTGAIYGHFRNKVDLLVEAINRYTSDEMEARTVGLGAEPDYIKTLTLLAGQFRKRRRLRALIVQGAAAAVTDDETRQRLREEQLAHIDYWIKGYERDRDRLGIDASVDIQAAVLYTWAAELGLGVLECVGIEPKSATGWADVHNRVGRSLQLPAEEQPPKRRGRSRQRR